MVLNYEYQKVCETAMGSFGYGNLYLRIYAKLLSQSISNNTSTIQKEMRVYNDGYYCYSGNCYANVEGVSLKFNERVDFNATSEIVVGSITSTVNHAENGDGSGWTEGAFSCHAFTDKSTSGGFDLPRIARYPTSKINSFTNTINSILLKCNYSNATPTKVEVRNGNTVIKTVTSNFNSINLEGLSPNTLYKLKIRGYANGGWGEYSSVKNITTYDYAKFTNLSNSNFADSVNITKVNESGLANDLEVYINDDLILSRTNIENSYELIFTQEELDSIYKKYSNSNTVTVKYKLITICNNISYTDEQERDIILTGNAKTIRKNINNELKRAKIYIKKDGAIKEAIAWFVENGITKRCI